MNNGWFIARGQPFLTCMLEMCTIKMCLDDGPLEDEMKQEAYEWKQSQPMAEDYLHQFHKVKDLYDFDPWAEDVWLRRAEWLDREEATHADRQAVADALRRYNESAANAPEAMENIAKLSDSRTLAVVGGQQAGLFTGPLLVIYKAITLLWTARQAESVLGRPVVPVFWIAGEDHDINEANHTYILTQQAAVHKIKVDAAGEARLPVSGIRFSSEQWEEAIGQLEEGLIDTEFKPQLLQMLRDDAKACTTLTEWFARLMARLFGSSGLVLLDSNDPGIRCLESPMYERLVADNRKLSEALDAGREAVETLGYEPQAEIHSSQANLFLFVNGERTLLHYNGTSFTDKKGSMSLTPQQLQEIAVERPELLSNNVVTRPLMQEYLFPVLATVLGPGEIAYWGLTRPAFHTLGMRMPVIVPRFQATLLEGTVQKQMDRFALSIDDVLFRLEEKKTSWLGEQDQLHLDEQFTEVKAQFERMYHPLIETIAGINPSLKKLGETNLTKIIEQIEYLENRAGDAYRSQFDAALRHWNRIEFSILPLGKPQERVYNIFVYLNKYGLDWLRELQNLPLWDGRTHNMIYI